MWQQRHVRQASVPREDHVASTCVPPPGPHLLVPLGAPPAPSLPPLCGGEAVHLTYRGSYRLRRGFFPGGCGGGGGEEKGREAETGNQYIHSITQCTHFLAVWPYLITDIKARHSYFNLVSGDRRPLMPVFLNMSVTTGSDKAAQCDSYANKTKLTPFLLHMHSPALAALSQRQHKQVISD